MSELHIEGFKGTQGKWIQDSVGDVYSEKGERIKVNGLCFPTGWSGDKGKEYNANTKLVTAAPELLAALQWAMPLALRAIEGNRLIRVRYGHTDILGTYSNGETWVGIFQEEVNQIENVKALIKRALGE